MIVVHTRARGARVSVRTMFSAGDDAERTAADFDENTRSTAFGHLLRSITPTRICSSVGRVLKV